MIKTRLLVVYSLNLDYWCFFIKITGYSVINTVVFDFLQHILTIFQCLIECHKFSDRWREKIKAHRTILKEKINWSTLLWWKCEGGTHTARKRGNVAPSSLCFFACGCVHNRHMHTSGCHNSSSSHKIEGEKVLPLSAQYKQQHSSVRSHRATCTFGFHYFQHTL